MNRNSKTHQHLRLYNDMIKYGKENFVIKEICECDDKAQLAHVEETYTKMWKFQYGANMIYNEKNGDKDQQYSNELILKHRLVSPTKRKINQYDLNGNFIKTFESIHAAAREVNGNVGNIYSCCQGTRDKAKGYRWKYTEE